MSSSRPKARATESEPARGATALHSGRRHALALAASLVLVGAVVAAAHWPVLRAQALALDDYEYVTYNPLVSQPGWTSAGRFFSEVLRPSSVKGYYHPLAMTSLMLDYAMGGRGNDLRAFHRTSLALHALNAALLVLLLVRLFGSLIPAALAGLMFGLHPLTVEPTVWVSERKALLAALFGFACLLSYVRYSHGRRRRWMFATVALYALAFLSKPTATTLPLLLLLLDYWPLRRLGPRTVTEKWPLFLLMFVFGAITLLSQHRVGGIAAATPSDVLRWPVQAGYVPAFYLAKIVWPANLSCIYARPEPLALSNPVVLLAVGTVAALTIALVLLARRARGPLAGWLFFVVALAPTLTLGLVRYSWVMAFDNYVYAPALGIVVVLTRGFAAWWDSRRREISTRGSDPEIAPGA